MIKNTILFLVVLTSVLIFIMSSTSANASTSKEVRYRASVGGKPATCFIKNNDYVFFCVRDQKYYNLFGTRINLPVSKEEETFRKWIYK